MFKTINNNLNNPPTPAETVDGKITVAVNPVQKNTLPTQIKIKIAVWKIVQATLFRFSLSHFNGWRRFLLRCFGASLANTAAIRNSARIDCPWNLKMGPHSSIGEHSWIYTLDKIDIGENACVGQFVKLLTGSHDPHDPRFPLITKPIVIGYGCWIAVGAIVLPGIQIGDLTVVGAGSVVTKNLPQQTICAGNPCRPIKKRFLLRSVA